MIRLDFKSLSWTWGGKLFLAPGAI